MASFRPRVAMAKKLLGGTRRTEPLCRPPPVPDNFIPRPAEYDAIKGLLLAGVAITTALRGAGGYGKTTLAAALARDPDLLRQFGGRAYWVTLGKTPDVGQELAALYSDVSGNSAGFTSVDDAVEQINAALGKRACLFVIDDVWQQGHLAPFLKLGSRGARLFTTRSFKIADQKDAVKVDRMTEDEATGLLAARITPETADLDLLKPLVRRLGLWPLLIKLAAPKVRDWLRLGGTVEGATDHISGRLSEGGVHTFDAEAAASRDKAVKVTLQMSLEELNESERAAFFKLAVFPEDTDIPMICVAAACGMCRVIAEMLVLKLAELSLVESNTQVVSLHDVIGDYLDHQLSDKPLVHAALVEWWRDPFKLPDEFAWKWYPYHLLHARGPAAARELLLDYRWLAEKLAATGPEALVADYSLLEDDADARLVQSAVRLSSHVLSADGGQLVPQLVGRLIGNVPPAIGKLVRDARQSEPLPWLCPLAAGLTQAGGALLHVLRGHDSGVYAVAVTPDGKRAVSGSSDSTLRVWDLGTGQELRKLEGHGGGVTAVALMPDGKRALSGSFDHTLRMWDLDSGSELQRLEGHRQWVTSVALTPDGTCAVSASADLTLRVWDLGCGRELRKLERHGAHVRVDAVAVTPDGKQVVSRSDDQTLHVWDLDSGRELRKLDGQGGWIHALALRPDGKRAVSASEDPALLVWDLVGGRELRKLEGHAGPVYAVALTPDGKRALSGSRDQTVRMWALDSGRELLKLEGHGGEVRAVALTPDGKWAVSGSDDHTLRVWDLERGQQVRKLDWHGYRFVLTPDAKRAVWGPDERSSLWVWDLDSMQGPLELAEHGEMAFAIALTPDGRRAVSVSELESDLDPYPLADPEPGSDWGKVIHVWDLDHACSLLGLSVPDYALTAIALTPDGTRVVSGSEDGTLRVWDSDSGEQLQELRGHEGSVTAVALTPDGTRAVSASQDMTLRVWELDSGQELLELRGHDGAVTAVAVTPDGTRAVSASQDMTLRVWDLDNGQQLRKLRGQGKIALTPDGKQLISASSDRTVRVWSLHSGRELAVFTGDNDMTCCAAENDGTIVAGDEGGRLHFLKLITERAQSEDPATPATQATPAQFNTKEASMLTPTETPEEPPPPPRADTGKAPAGARRPDGAEKVEILFLAANPKDTAPLALDEEIREITNKIRASEHRDRLLLSSHWAMRPDDLLQLLNERSPTIVHFSGHGSNANEIILVDDQRQAKPVSQAAIEGLFRELGSSVRVVVLNACFSEAQARGITKHVDCAIGMSRAIGDKAAITFAASFYRAIGFGKSVRQAFDQGKLALQLEGIPEERTPQLLVRDGVDASLMVLVSPGPPASV
jgi:WD40 repeat protein